MARKGYHQHRLDSLSSPSLRNWQDVQGSHAAELSGRTVIEMGWGRLIFAHTFQSHERLIETLRQEAPGKRDIAIYLRDPHVILSLSPQELFLDPSHTYRLWLHLYKAPRRVAIVDHLPRDPNGKVRKAQLRSEWLAQAPSR